MASPRVRLLRLLAVPALALAFVAVPAPAQAAAGTATGTDRAQAAAAWLATRSGCDPAGVTVVVDFRAFGGSVQVGCTQSDPATGVAALTMAGFGVEGTRQWGLAFVCRINQLPTPADEACAVTPSATAYWSYWHASPGGSWGYGSTSAASYNPAPGTVEGWSFGSGGQPGIAPPAFAAPPAPPPPPPAGGGGGGGGSGTEPSPDASPPAAPSPSGSPSSTSTMDSPATTTTTTTTASTVIAEPPAGGGLTGTLIGAGLVLVVGGVGAMVALRRRAARVPVPSPVPSDDGPG
jgi:hypothetical protein